ncbi:MAG TPA: sigma-70 family RNA polymerase sigma factor [Planctomycetota bacterium]
MDAARHALFAQRFVLNQNRVFRYILGLVPHRTDAEDLFQQTCLTLWETWDRYDAAQDFVPWACGIALNLVRNHRRKRGSLALSDALLERLGRRRLELDDLLEERRKMLDACLEALPGPMRRLVEEAYGGEDVERIARRSKQTPNAIYKTLRRIRAALHDCVSRKLAPGGAP